MKLRIATLVWGLAWLGCVRALLQFGTLPGDLGHSLLDDVLCGPWG